MKLQFIGYAKCGTCQKAQKWLKANGIDVPMRDIVTENPTKDELSAWIHRSTSPVNKFFNTSGLRYKELGLKDVVKSEPESKLIELLASEDKLVKRPIMVIDDTKVLVGFKEEEWREALLK